MNTTNTTNDNNQTAGNDLSLSLSLSLSLKNERERKRASFFTRESISFSLFSKQDASQSYYLGLQMKP